MLWWRTAPSVRWESPSAIPLRRQVSPGKSNKSHGRWRAPLGRWEKAPELQVASSVPAWRLPDECPSPNGNNSSIEVHIMKFEMSSSEFATFSAALALAEVTKLNQAHTSELESLQAEVREARHERNEAWDKIDTLRDEIRSLEHSRDSAGYETSRLRSEVQTLLARLHNL